MTVTIQEDLPLSKHTTMKIGGTARYAVEVTCEDDLLHAVAYARDHSLPIYVLGGGSNVIARDGTFDGVVIINKIPGFVISAEDDASATIIIGAGESWDSTVAKLVHMGLTGVESLSGIPGSVGAAPVQNIGAYGQDLSSTLISVRAYDTKRTCFADLSASECQLGYRSSIFREKDYERYIITQITLKLTKGNPLPPYYQSVQDYIDSHNIPLITPAVIRNIVLDIRAHKLPDPALLPNAGSFFKNAIVTREIYENIKEQFPDTPSYPAGDMVKIPTGWLIEQTGLKGRLLHGIRVHDKNALVLINESARHYSDLVEATQEIVDAVQKKFGISIEQEPLELRLA